MEWSSQQTYPTTSKRACATECSLTQSRSTPTLIRPEPLDCLAQGLGFTVTQRSPGKREYLLGSDTELGESKHHRRLRGDSSHHRGNRKKHMERRMATLENCLKLMLVVSCLTPIALTIVGTGIAPTDEEISSNAWGTGRRQLTSLVSVFGCEKSYNTQKTASATDVVVDESRLSARIFKNPFKEIQANRYLLGNNDQRAKEHIGLLVGVLSTCKNFDRRQAVRRTWKSLAANDAWQGIFVLGEECAHVPKIQKEAERYHDLLFLPVQESYATIDTKVLGFVQFAARGAEWAAEVQCSEDARLWGGDGPDIVMKADDDTFVRVELLLEQLKVWAFLESHQDGDASLSQENKWLNLTVPNLYWGYPSSTAGFLELSNLPQTHKWHVAHESTYKKVELNTVSTDPEHSRLWGGLSIPNHSIQIDQLPDSVTYGQGGGWVLSRDVALSIAETFESDTFSVPYPYDGWLEDATIGVLIARVRPEVKFLPDERFCTDGNNMDICTCAPNTILYHHSAASNSLKKDVQLPYPMTALPDVMDFFFSNIIEGQSDGLNRDLSGFNDVMDSILLNENEEQNSPLKKRIKNVGLCGEVDLNKDWGNKAHPLTSVPDGKNRRKSHEKIHSQQRKNKKKKPASAQV